MTFNYCFCIKLEQEPDFKGFVVIFDFGEITRKIGYLELVDSLPKDYNNTVGWGYRALDLARRPIGDVFAPFPAAKQRALRRMAESFFQKLPC